MDLYDVARQVTDEVMGYGTYAKVNEGNPDPNVQRAIANTPSPAPTQWEKYAVVISPDGEEDVKLEADTCSGAGALVSQVMGHYSEISSFSVTITRSKTN